ncbi:hypothetical protein TNCV_3577681 [Trichonephila clavipes]|uniref:Uncharacterized protein n=1 Tax=Trichonephila clavipes TaxID=2585209 RepID=A0A8X6V275_TRICX|nr:hypothetical protein TNCV_3577681 [Trichonephila clavipes]
MLTLVGYSGTRMPLSKEYRGPMTNDREDPATYVRLMDVEHHRTSTTKIKAFIWHQSVTGNRIDSIACRMATSLTLSSVHTNSSKSLMSPNSVLSMEDRMMICCFL